MANVKEEMFRFLPVRLRDDEKATKAYELAKAVEDYGDIEARKKAATTEMAEKMKEKRSEIDLLSRIVATGTERRDVQCWKEPNMVNKTWEIRRNDTGEIVEQHSMSASEVNEIMQISMDLKTPPSDAPTA